MKYICLVFLFVYFARSISAYFITVDANEEQCFFDSVTSGTKMSLMFEVAEGGFLDIDVKVSYCLKLCCYLRRCFPFINIQTKFVTRVLCTVD